MAGHSTTAASGPEEVTDSARLRRRPFVLMIAPGPFLVDRGFGIAVYEQAKALRRRRIRVEVVAYHSGRQVPDIPIHRAAPLPGYDATAIGPSLTRLPLWILLLHRTLDVARRTRPDVLHGHLHEGALVARLVSSLLDIPWVFDFQGSLSLELAEKSFLRPGSLPFRLISLGERQIDRPAPRILVKSTTMQRDLEDRFGVDPSRIARIMDGTDPDVFSPRPADPVLRRRWGIAPNAVVVGYLGLLTAQQGVDRLLQAAAVVLERHPECHFLVMGYPVERARQLARELHILSGITLTGRVDYFTAPDHLALVDLALAPKVSRTEGNGKIYNYMSMALPVAAIDTPGNREILGEDGYYARGESFEDFATAIIDALRSRDQWEDRGIRLRRRLEERFTWAAVASRLVAAYQDVAPQRFDGLGD